jgi:transcription elongation factor Elf1
MARTTCPKCGSTTFENATISAKGAAFQKTVVQCSACGTPIGIMDIKNVIAEIGDLSDRLDRIEKILMRALARE